MMSLPYKIGIAALLLLAIFAAGYMAGRGHGRVAALKAAVAAYQARDKIDGKVQNMGDVDLCVALGGGRDECQNIKEGMK